jgi:hypothetical protein
MMKIQGVQRNGVAVTAFIACTVAGAATSAWLQHPAPVIAGMLIGIYLLFAIQVIKPWDRVALMRLGRYVGLRGPGLFHIVPVFETLSQYVTA